MTKEEYDDIAKQYSALTYAKLRKMIIQDLNDTANKNNFLLKKYNREQIEKFLLNPDQPNSQKGLRDISRYFYAVSPHYRRLIEFFANLSTLNYYIQPCTDVSKVDVKSFTQEYHALCLQCEKYHLKTEIPRILTSVFLVGVFYGITFESKDSFIIKPIDDRYADITTNEDGVLRFSFDLNYFNGTNKKYLVDYGIDFENAYDKYKGNTKKNIEPDKNQRWYEPKNQICIKFDEETLYSIPVFAGLFTSLIELDTYKEIKKDKAIMDNFRLIHYEIPTDSDGVPKMTFEQANQYYDLTASSLPEGVGLAMSPFKAENFTLKNTSSDEDFVEEATKSLFANAGLNPLLFGLGNNPTSQTLSLSTKPDEALTNKVLHQIANVFNLKYKKTNPKYYMEIVFLNQSIFDKDDISNAYLKAAQYGCPTKLQYISSLGVSPAGVTNMTILENDILNMPIDMFNHPLISSNTLSNGGLAEDNTGGRPTTDKPSDNTELGQDNNTENR